MINLIVAYDKNKVIGSKGKIPWNIKGEQKRFKELTTNQVVIMGRRSYEEIGHPLPNRTTIVISTTKKYEMDHCYTAASLEEALKIAGNRDIYIAGGARLYEEVIHIVDCMYITEIDLEVTGDTYFPDFPKQKFEKVIVEEFHDEIPYSYVTYSRIKKETFE